MFVSVASHSGLVNGLLRFCCFPLWKGFISLCYLRTGLVLFVFENLLKASWAGRGERGDGGGWERGEGEGGGRESESGDVRGWMGVGCRE